MRAYKIVVTGKVQKRGYRNKVFQIANELDINGCVTNLANNDVEVIAEHENEAILRQFIARIKIVNGLIKVMGVKIEAIKPAGYSDFEITRGDKQDEMLESLDYAAGYLSEIKSEVKATREEVKATRVELKEEMHGMRGDMKSFIGTSFRAIVREETAGLKKEIQKIKAKIGSSG